MTHGMKLSLLAVKWSCDPVFIAFLNRHLQTSEDASVRYGTQKGDLDPADYIRECCGIDSRKDLDTNERAARAFHRVIRAPFMQWKLAQQQNQAA